MFQNRYLARWQEANLLDVGQVQRIQAWEAANARPVGLWAISGLGVFSVVLGILAIIGANWEAIPPSFKLGFVLALTSLVAVALFIAALRGLAWPRELLALLLFGLVIGGIALISQIYQLGGQVWTALLVWVLVCTPFLVLATRSSMAALA